MNKLPAPERQNQPKPIPSTPLSDKMQRVLQALLKQDGWYGMTGNEIGMALGHRSGEVKASVGGASKYSGIRSMGAAQKIIPCLTALSRRKLIYMAARQDGRSGTAYRLTDAGLAEALRIQRQEKEAQGVGGG